MVARATDARNANEDGTLKVDGAKRVELLEGESTFLLSPDQVKSSEADHVAHLDQAEHLWS